MLNEPSFVPQKVGWIEVICGGMFSGKTEGLIQRANRGHIAGGEVQVICIDEAQFFDNQLMKPITPTKKHESAENEQ